MSCGNQLILYLSYGLTKNVGMTSVVQVFHGPTNWSIHLLSSSHNVNDGRDSHSTLCVLSLPWKWREGQPATSILESAMLWCHWIFPSYQQWSWKKSSAMLLQITLFTIIALHLALCLTEELILEQMMHSNRLMMMGFSGLAMFSSSGPREEWTEHLKAWTSRRWAAMPYVASVMSSG